MTMEIKQATAKTGIQTQTTHNQTRTSFSPPSTAPPSPPSRGDTIDSSSVISIDERPTHETKPSTIMSRSTVSAAAKLIESTAAVTIVTLRFHCCCCVEDEVEDEDDDEGEDEDAGEVDDEDDGEDEDEGDDDDADENDDADAREPWHRSSGSVYRYATSPASASRSSKI